LIRTCIIGWSKNANVSIGTSITQYAKINHTIRFPNQKSNHQNHHPSGGRYSENDNN